MSAAELRESLSLAMDGVVLSTPPKDAVARWNHCYGAEDHVWRKRSEGNHVDLLGHDLYANQVPLDRAVPLWGGISEGGFAEVVIHKQKKLNEAEWTEAVKAGKLNAAIKSLNPVKTKGPWTVPCDNEGFLKTAASTKAHKKAKVLLWHVPKLSPDLNPVEKFWSWLRRRLRALDLRDIQKKRPVLAKMAYVKRVRSVCRSKKAQQVAKACAKGWKRVCQEVVRKKGAASRG